MNSLLKLAIIGFAVWFAYDYWKKNISTTGKLQSKKQQIDRSKEINALAEKLRSETMTLRYAECDARYMPKVYEWSDVARCKQLVDVQVSQMDFVEMAKGKLGL